MKAYRQRLVTCGLTLLIFAGTAEFVRAGPVSVRSEDFEPVNWAYSSFFGTGWYQIKDARSVFVLRVPPKQTLRESSISASGERRLGVEINYHFTLGLHDVEDLGGIIENDNFGTVSFTPGVELEFPVTQKWYLRSFAHIGWGKELQVGESAWIYYAGIKSRYTFPAKRVEWSLLNSLYYAGYSPDQGRSDHLAVAELGVELKQPFLNARLAGRPVDLHWNLMYSFMGHELHFNLPDGAFDPIDDTLELGLQMSFRDGPYKFWFFNVQRLGVGYRASSSGQFTAITFSMSSWFTK